MSGNTLLGIIVGMVAGAFLVDTFQPAQDVYDNCKTELREKIDTVKTSVKNAKKAVVDTIEHKE